MLLPGATATCSAGAGNSTVLVTFLVCAFTSSSAPDWPLARASPMTPVADSATERALSLTEKLVLTWPVAEPISNSPALSGPVSAHMAPLACSSVVASMLLGAARMCWGSMP